MPRLFILATAFVALLIMSVLTPSAHAYMTPEEVIFSDEFMYPPKPAEARQRVQAQNDAAAAAREAVYADLAAERNADKAQSSSAPATTNSPDSTILLDDLAAIVSALQQGGMAITPANTVDTGTEGLTTEERRRERLLDRLDERDAERLHGAAPYSYGSEQLHSGAPLAHTGMETYAVIGLVGAAIFWTLRRATKKGYVEVKY